MNPDGIFTGFSMKTDPLYCFILCLTDSGFPPSTVSNELRQTFPSNGRFSRMHQLHSITIEKKKRVRERE